jgi:hypothetical protein
MTNTLLHSHHHENWRGHTRGYPQLLFYIQLVAPKSSQAKSNTGFEMSLITSQVLLYWHLARWTFLEVSKPFHHTMNGVSFLCLSDSEPLRKTENTHLEELKLPPPPRNHHNHDQKVLLLLVFPEFPMSCSASVLSISVLFPLALGVG